jgi:uncharacterized protein YraI
MSRVGIACLCAVLALAALVTAPIVSPVPALAASGTLGVDAPLQEGPQDETAAITYLPAGSEVSIDGQPVDGFYPVTADGVAGWVRGDALLIQDDGYAPAPASDEGAALAATGEAAVDLAASDPTSGAIIGEAPAEAPPGEVAIAPEPDPALTGTPLPVAATNAAPAVDPAAAPDPNAPTVPVPDAGPSGPAAVASKAPILAGPGPDYGTLATAAPGSMVEQTGHLVDGYVTVRYGEVTGWIPLDSLGSPDEAGDDTEARRSGNKGD